MNNATLVRLERVDLRDVWSTEVGDFTPWLAGADNLSLLGDSIGLELELEAQEKDVGPFRADILLVRRQVDAFRFEHVAGIRQTGLYVFRRQVIVFAENLLKRPAARQQVNHELYGDSRPFDDWLTNQHLWVNRYAIFPRHRSLSFLRMSFGEKIRAFHNAKLNLYIKVL